MVPTSSRALALVLASAAALATLGLTTPAPATAVPSRVDLVPTTGQGHHKTPHATLEGAAHARSGRKWAAGAASGSGDLIYRGGVNGIGVTTGPPKVYLIFWGTQWGTAGTDSNGNTTFTGDPMATAPILQQMFKGIGTGGETWSGVMTQFCEAETGATTCPTNAPHVGYPTGGSLAGVWYDNSAAAPTTATDRQIGLEAYAGLSHFGNTTAAFNRNAQYVVISPTGTHPGGFNAPLNWCAWHDYNGDTTLGGGGAITSAYGDFAFTNLPYLTDVGASCGANYVNAGAAGLTDGVSMVEGHEYSETISDQNPAGGWTDTLGYENADKCTWNGVGGAGGSQNVTLGTSGTFAMQATYSNDGSACLISHPIVTTSSTVVAVATPATQSSAQGAAITPVTPAAVSSDSTSTAITWSATNLPVGLTINATTGAITGSPTTKTVYNTRIRATDSVGAAGFASITWTVAGNTVTVASPGNQTSGQSLTITPLTTTATDSNAAITAFAWSATGLPVGLTIASATGIISGKPTTKASYSVTITAKDSTNATGTASFTWTITGTTVTVATIATQTSSRSTTVTSVQATATDSNTTLTTFTWSATGLPTGLTINSTTGLISGKVGSRTGTSTVKVSAKDSTGTIGTVTFSWKVV